MAATRATGNLRAAQHLSTLWVCIAGVSLLGACAHASSGGIMGQLVKPGKPKAEIGPPQAAPKESLESYIGKVRRLAAQPPVRSNDALSAESWDPRLRDALLTVSLAPSAAHHRQAAEAYRRLGILDRAYDHFSRAARIDPADAAAYDGLARIWRDWRVPALALGDALRAVYHAPSSAAAQNTLGTILQALGRREAAQRAYERALALDPDAWYALNNLCYVFVLNGDVTRAIAACRGALDRNPDLAAARNNLGLAYAIDGRLDEAGLQFLQGADEAARQYNMGIVFLAKRQYGKAAEAFDRASRLRPALVNARRRARQAREFVSRFGDGAGE